MHHRSIKRYFNNNNHFSLIVDSNVKIDSSSSMSKTVTDNVIFKTNTEVRTFRESIIKKI